MRELELLAPARNLECGIAAIDHGADAVYIGASRFGARASAGNSLDDIRQLCTYAHQFAAKVYVTVNTILYDDELAATRQLLDELTAIGVDAILVQDMAVLSMSPAVPLHASTQTDNRTAAKVSWLRSLGFTRMVLARELSLEEIRDIHRQVPDVELEVFVHGALCVSYSGLCYASQHCFRRSANRGECAQFCRMKFDLLDADGRVIERDRHLLSLKDLNQSDHLEQLAAAGATSFKIEGRLKDVSYVKNVTAAYSNRLNDIVRRHPDRYRRASLGRCTYTFTPNLAKTFNRGYTTYFLEGRQPDIASFDTPKAIGEFVGTVKELRHNSFNVAGVASFANGDGLCFLDADRQLQGFRVNRVEGNRLFPHHMPEGLRPGMRLYRNSDMGLDRLLSRPSAERKIPVTLSLQAVPDGFTLACGSVEVSLPMAHQLADRPQRDNIVRQLSRLGGTPYVCVAVNLPADFPYFIPSSSLSELRRQLVSRLMAGAAAHSAAAGSAAAVSEADTAKAAPHCAYAQPHLYNIANLQASRFYGQPAPSAYELRPQPGALIMQCRHCLRYALGGCVRHGGRRPAWREPLALRLGDGRLFPLEFDCVNCQMNVYAPRT